MHEESLALALLDREDRADRLGSSLADPEINRPGVRAPNRLPPAEDRFGERLLVSSPSDPLRIV